MATVVIGLALLTALHIINQHLVKPHKGADDEEDAMGSKFKIALSSATTTIWAFGTSVLATVAAPV